MDMIFLFNTF